MSANSCLLSLDPYESITLCLVMMYYVNKLKMKSTPSLSLCYLIFICLSIAAKSVDKKCSIPSTGAEGICTEAEKCNSAKYNFEILNVEPTFCEISSKKVLVCCLDDIINGRHVASRESNGEAEIFSSPQKTRQSGVSEEKCQEYSALVTENFNVYSALPQSEAIPISVEKCDYAHNRLIVGGNNAKRGQFPHMALLGWINIESGNYDWNCGGTLISEQFVLTATHCTFHKKYSNPRPTIVRLGEHNLNSHRRSSLPQDVPIRNIILHPKYVPGKKYHDIALLKLRSKIEIGKYIRPACLWTKPKIDERTAIVSGWGATEYQGTTSPILQYAVLDLIDQRECKRIYSASSERKVFDSGIIDEQLCAGKLEGGKDTCQGDSGGPIQIVSKSNKCVYYIVGITSFGIGCGLANISAIYTRVDRYVDWIESHVWP